MSDRPLVHQAPLFAVVGLLATATHVTVALIARSLFRLTPMEANFAGYLAAVSVSYLGNARLTFRRRARDGGQMLRFAVVSLCGLALTQGLTWLLVTRAGWPFGVGLAVVAVAVPAFSFVLSRVWAFRAAT